MLENAGRPDYTVGVLGIAQLAADASGGRFTSVNARAAVAMATCLAAFAR